MQRIIGTLIAALIHLSTIHGVFAQAKFEGHVVDNSGNPVAGAKVFLAKSYMTEPGTRIVGQVESTEDGRFEIEFTDQGYFAGIAYFKGMGLGLTGLRNVQGGPIPSKEGSHARRIELSEAKSLSCKIKDSQGAPAKILSAKVSSLEFQGTDYWEFGNQSDIPLPIHIDGNAISIDWLCDGLGVRVHIESERDLPQDVHVPFNAELPQALQLIGQTKITGKIKTSEDSATIHPDSKVTVQVSNPPYSGNNQNIPRIFYQTSAKPDNQGNYEITAIAGTATIHFQDGRTKNNSQSHSALLELGKTLQRDFEMKELVTVNGKCIDEQGDPVQGVVISPSATSDEQGEFQFRTQANQNQCTITKVPDGYLAPYESWVVFRPEKGATQHTLPDIVLRKPRPFSGEVVDVDGNPVANAEVRANWRATNGRTSTSKGQVVKSDDQGRFTVTKADKFDVRLTASTDALATTAATILTMDDRESVTLTVTPDGKFEFSGTIIDSKGKPIVDARIKVSQKVLVPGTDFAYGERHLLREQPVKTGRDGHFEFPVKLPRSEEFKLEIEAKGFVSQQVSSLVVPDSGDLKLKPISLKASRSARGIVVDSSGAPVSGASVWSHGISNPNQHSPVNYRAQLGLGVTTKTDEEGRFEISEIHSDASFVFAAKDGYQMAGKSLSVTGEQRIELLSRKEAGVPLRLKKIDRQTKQAQLQRLLDFIRSVEKEPSRYSLIQQLECRQMAAPESFGEFIKEMEFGFNKAPWLAAMGHHEDAFEACLAQSTPYWRLSALTACAAKTKDSKHKSALLKEAGFRLKNLADTRRRVEMASSIIDDLIDDGHYELARDIAEYVTPIALEMNLEGRNEFSKAWYGKALVRLDYELAWELIKDSRNTGNQTSGGFPRHAGNMAHELAASDPERAIQLLNEIPEQMRARYVQRVATRMAPVDSERAIGLIENSIKNGHNVRYAANGFGSVAKQLKDSDPDRAKKLLQRGFDLIFGSPDQLNDRLSFGYPVNLLRFESQIQSQSSSNFWRVMEMFADPNVVGYWGGNVEREAVLQRAKPALLLELFDREPEVSSALLEPVFKYFENPPVENKKWCDNLTDYAYVFVALALHDPERTVTMHESLFHKIPEDRRNYIPMPWVAIARSIASDPDARVDYLAELSYTWRIGEED